MRVVERKSDMYIQRKELGIHRGKKMDKIASLADSHTKSVLKCLASLTVLVAIGQCFWS